MGEVTTIRLDIAKSVFQAHGADASGSVVFRKKLDRIDTQMAVLDAEIARHAKKDAVARRLMTIAAIGPVTAAALVALAPTPEAFPGRDFSAWVELAPLQRSTGGKQKLG